MYGKEGEALTQEIIDKFRYDYYKSLDFMYWRDRLEYSGKRLYQVKSIQIKSRMIVDIYSMYMQLVEIFLIHANSIGTNPRKFIRTLGITNKEIRECADAILKNDTFMENLLVQFVHAVSIEAKDEDRLRREKRLLIESIKDYKANYKFLNAYKHGYRVNSMYGPNSLSVGISGKQMTKIMEGDSSIGYYEVEGNMKKGYISTVDIIFNIERIHGTALFLVSTLENMRLTCLRILNKEEKVRYTYFGVNDEKEWNKSFGNYHWKTGLFEYGHSQQKMDSMKP